MAKISVLSLNAVFIVSWSITSVSPSSDDVGSSKTAIFEFNLTKDRAKEIFCLCPPERLLPPSFKIFP